MRQFAKSIGQLITALLLVAAGGVLGAGLVVLMNDGTYLRATDKFDIFINVLFVTFGMLTLGGFVTYNVVRETLDRRIEAAKEELRNSDEVLRNRQRLSIANLLRLVAYAHWRESELLWGAVNFLSLEERPKQTGKRETWERVRLYLDMAIEDAERALVPLKDVIPLEETKDEAERAEIRIKNALAYALASRRNPDHLSKAVALAEEVEAAADGDYNRLETVAWVLMRFGTLAPETGLFERGREIIREILKGDDVKGHEREELLRQYGQCFPGEGFSDL